MQLQGSGSGRALLAASQPSCPRPVRCFAAKSNGVRARKADSEAAVEASSASLSEDQRRREASLQATMNALNKKYGARTVLELSDSSVQCTEWHSTGALTLDLALGGGLPKGGVVEIYGPESTGKTSLALSAIAAAQKKNPAVRCAFIDLEHALSREFATQLGVKMDQTVFSQPSSGDEALDIAAQLAGSGGVDIIVIDSVAALTPRQEVEGDIGAATMGAQARLMGSGLRALTPLVSKHKVCLIFINQIRMKLGVMFGNPETTPGGMALKFYALQRIELRKKSGTTPAGKEPTGITIKAKVVKNKVAAPGKTCEYDFNFTRGIDSQGCLLTVAENLGLVEKRGSWYFVAGAQVAQGRERTLQYLQDNPDQAETLQQQVLAALGDKEIAKRITAEIDSIAADGFEEMDADYAATG